MTIQMQVQRRLKELGYYKGEIDGLFFRLSTQALARYQKDRGLPIKWPGTIGPITLAALGITNPPVVQTIPWLEVIRHKMGLHERLNNKELKEWLRSDGPTLGDPSVYPWCGDLVETAIGLTLPNEPIPTNPYLARNWLKFGDTISSYMLGAIAVFWRGSRNGISGHVGIVAGQRKGYLYIAGGNQGNRISVAPLSTDRLLGLRWPHTYDNPMIPAPQMTGGTISTNEF